MFASLNLQPAPEPGQAGDTFMLTVQDCKTGHAIGNRQAVDAIRAFNDYRVSNGMAIPTFVWFPTAGNGEADFDFKLVHAYADAQTWGNSVQWFTENMAYLTRGQIMDEMPIRSRSARRVDPCVALSSWRRDTGLAASTAPRSNVHQSDTEGTMVAGRHRGR